MDFSSLKGKTVFITGFKKNCGKTVFLNHILSAMKNVKKGFFSIGLDGEKKDSVSFSLKPEVYAAKGDIIALNKNFLKCEALLKIVNVFDSGNIVLAQVIRPGRVQIGGASENFNTSLLINRMRDMGCETVLVDGAFDRFTQISSVSDCSFYYVAKISPENILSASQRISLIHLLNQIPLIKENAVIFQKMTQDYLFIRDSVFLKGALTASKLDKISQYKKIFLEDPSKVFLDYTAFSSLLKDKSVFFAVKPRLLGFIVNLYNTLKEDFENKLAGKDILKSVYYNPYEHKEIC